MLRDAAYILMTKSARTELSEIASKISIKCYASEKPYQFSNVLKQKQCTADESFSHVEVSNKPLKTLFILQSILRLKKSCFII